MNYLSLLDMIDGGGAGRAGQTFEGGGGFSSLLNMIGVRPAGFQDRLAAARPKARPDLPRPRVGMPERPSVPVLPPDAGMPQPAVAPQMTGLPGLLELLEMERRRMQRQGMIGMPSYMQGLR